MLSRDVVGFRTMSEFMQRCKYFFKTEAVEKNGGYKSSSRDLSGRRKFSVPAIYGRDDVYFSLRKFTREKFLQLEVKN